MLCGLHNRRRKTPWLALVCQAALAISLSGAVPDDSLRPEYQLEANFLAMSPSFVEWPVEAGKSSTSAFLLCVYGDFHFGTSLAEMTRTTSGHGRRVEVKWTRKEADLPTCNLVFVSRSEQKHYDHVLHTLRGTPTLTIGETPDFLQAGGVIGLEVQEKKLQFDVNLEAAEKAHLKISARLLALARRVTGSAQAARS